MSRTVSQKLQTAPNASPPVVPLCQSANFWHPHLVQPRGACTAASATNISTAWKTYPPVSDTSRWTALTRGPAAGRRPGE
ncbi:hypothetical protein AB205_0193170 [Aquarana catesbeiana]|uniref:Uncharacterized protein n=1 Tax=Aquarana catesbeiana TaxID=8400 RepID=A0A2G9QL43_AQUCT|nr:hypothetical protein AB205_0193170 [Aquarana catesbeiana]